MAGDCCGISDYSLCSECKCKYDRDKLLAAQILPNNTCLFDDKIIGDGFCQVPLIFKYVFKYLVSNHLWVG